MKTYTAMGVFALLCISTGVAAELPMPSSLADSQIAISVIDVPLLDIERMMTRINGLEMRIDPDVLKPERFGGAPPSVSIFFVGTARELVAWFAYLAKANVSFDGKVIRLSTPEKMPNNNNLFNAGRRYSAATNDFCCSYLTNEVISVSLTNADWNTVIHELYQSQEPTPDPVFQLIISPEAQASLRMPKGISLTATNAPVDKVLQTIADKLQLDMAVRGGVVVIEKKTSRGQLGR